ncbi:hypothetical protein GQ53DRAFT_46952 [Thozetella sp. PMI_491]|nr:hypothetical protein GQ53DRAFT_93525 [Thozetella sp. PMI_491]KAH8879103.1 hypothetical protein GQ53DRAFT_46952 [Thozetella sp. PMI_491]
MEEREQPWAGENSHPNETNEDGQHVQNDGKPTLTRKWTPFEMQTVLALICQGVHYEDTETFTDELNKALNPGAEHYRERFKDDIEESHVQNLLEVLHREKKAAIAFIDRQQMGRLTRSATMAFKRSIRFTRTEWEWLVEGRKDTEPAERSEQYRKCLDRMEKESSLAWANWYSRADGPEKQPTCDMNRDTNARPECEGSDAGK